MCVCVCVCVCVCHKFKIIGCAPGLAFELLLRARVRRVLGRVLTPRVLFPNRKPVTAALRYRFTGLVRPVTGGNRLNSNPNSNKFKFSRATGSDRFTGRFDRFTGRFDRFEIQKLPCNRFTDRFTGRFDRFDRWAFMGRPIFFLFLF